MGACVASRNRALTDVVWARSPAVSRPGAAEGLKLAGVANARDGARLRLARLAEPLAVRRRLGLALELVLIDERL